MTLQAACTPKELKELTTELGVVARVLPGQLAVSEQDEQEMKATRMKRRIVDLITKVCMVHVGGVHGVCAHGGIEAR